MATRGRRRWAAGAAAAVVGGVVGVGAAEEPGAAHSCIGVGTPVTTIGIPSTCSPHEAGTHLCIPLGDGVSIVLCVDPPP